MKCPKCGKERVESAVFFDVCYGCDYEEDEVEE